MAISCDSPRMGERKCSVTDKAFDELKELVSELTYALGKSHPEYTKQYRKLRNEQIRRNRKLERDWAEMHEIINGKGWAR
jgi:hypothetical protein